MGSVSFFFFYLNDLAFLILVSSSQVAEHLDLSPREIHRTKVQLIRALVLASSYGSNRRRLEERWSGFWQIILQCLANSVEGESFVVFHQFNLWRLNRDEHNLAILEIPMFEAPNSSLLPTSGEGEEASNTGNMTTKPEGISLYFFQNLGKGGRGG